MKEFDFSNIKLFIQLTAAGTATNGTYMGTYAGAGASSCLIRKAGTTLTGSGLATIASSYAAGIGYISSAQTTGSQVNLVDVSTQPKSASTILGSQLTSVPEANISLLAQTSTLASAANFSDATLGCYGITKFTTLTETQTLDQLVYNAMTALGRPVQTNPAYVLSMADLREGKTPITNTTTTALTKALLNTTYPMAVKGQKIYCPSVSGGAVVYQKTESTGDWAALPYTVVP